MHISISPNCLLGCKDGACVRSCEIMNESECKTSSNVCKVDYINIVNNTCKKYFGFSISCFKSSYTKFNSDKSIVLSDFPNAFIKNGKVETKIVIGEKARTDLVIGAVDLATYLQTKVSSQIGMKFAVLDKDAPAPGATNLIVIGGPCGNTVAARLLGNPANCAEGYKEGEAKLIIINDAGKLDLLIAGHTDVDTLNGVKTLITLPLPSKSSAIVSIGSSGILTVN